MKRPEPPCKPNREGCTKRQLGCRTDCEGWQKYEAAMAEYRREKENEIRQVSQIIEYQKRGKERMLRLKKSGGRK